MKFFDIVLLSASFAELIGCGASGSPPATPPPAPTSAAAAPVVADAAEGGSRSTCAEIASACHAHSKHSVMAQTCHDLGHSPDATEQQCSSKRAECLAACR